jgi:hypothetical protein
MPPETTQCPPSSWKCLQLAEVSRPPTTLLVLPLTTVLTANAIVRRTYALSPLLAILIGFGAVALSPDGDAVAYTLVSYRSDTTEAGTDLVVRELIVASDFLNLRIGEAGDSITSLAFDGERAGYLRTSAGAQSVTLLDLVDRSELPVDLIQAGDISSLSFARMPVTPTQ